MRDLRLTSGEMDTIGLSDIEIAKFCTFDPKLPLAITEALAYKNELINRLGKDVGFCRMKKNL